MRKIFIDLDGVLVNLPKALFELHGVEIPEDISILDRDIIGELLDFKTSTDVFKKLDKQDASFWENLEPYPWFQDIVDVVSKYDKDYYFLTKGTYEDSSYAGKHRWIKKHFGVKGLDKLIILTGKNRKSIVAKPSYVLIDDTDKNLEDWHHNGKGVSFKWEPIVQQSLADLQLSFLDSFLKALNK